MNKQAYLSKPKLYEWNKWKFHGYQNSYHVWDNSNAVSCGKSSQVKGVRTLQ